THWSRSRRHWGMISGLPMRGTAGPDGADSTSALVWGLILDVAGFILDVPLFLREYACPGSLAPGSVVYTGDSPLSVSSAAGGALPVRPAAAGGWAGRRAAGSSPPSTHSISQLPLMKRLPARTLTRSRPSLTSRATVDSARPRAACACS